MRYFLLLYSVLLALITPLSLSHANPVEPIKIGAIYGLTGAASGTNVNYLRGTELAVEYLMEKGGLLGRPIELIAFDNESTPLGSRQAAMDAIAAGVVAVVGPSWSSHAMIIGPILNQAKIPMIASNATHENVTKGLDYVFRSCFTDSFQGAVMATFARETLNAKTAVVLTNVNSEYSLGLLDIFSRIFTEHSGQILWKGEYQEKQVDFADILLPIKEFNPDVIYLPGHYRDTIFILKQAYQLGIKNLFLGADGMLGGRLSDYEPVESIEGVFFSTHWHPDIDTPISQDFKQRYLAKYPGVVPSGVANSFDAVLILADAITRANSTESEKIRVALTETNQLPVATGAISFDEHGDPLNKSVVILRVEKGELKLFKTVTPSF
ncbi:ABC transporter substrate-binding protein [Thioflexithrix psekupsensis]|uniref:Leucine-binding protein domain-containing protein n=1 Tax=Thioflexithrix psekupsensis TaxID=1570016 RepID=A0A251XCJ2_9GAMM|nr:ABC transporter substrate-binding protein [Thioflexithrix psekupsensis]OUD16313.1 hypothetical protein TPSD3_00910 [Thioflexithrix psekupsensis]